MQAINTQGGYHPPKKLSILAKETITKGSCYQQK